MRKLRHVIIDYGKKSGEEFLINNQEEVIIVIGKLEKVLRTKLNIHD